MAGPNVTRLLILRHLAGRPANLTELSRWLGIRKSAVHRHLQTLAGDAFVHRTRTGRWVYYRLAPEGERVVRGLALDM